jgi:hypothetical protein
MATLATCRRPGVQHVRRSSTSSSTDWVDSSKCATGAAHAMSSSLVAGIQTTCNTVNALYARRRSTDRYMAAGAEPSIARRVP